MNVEVLKETFFTRFNKEVKPANECIRDWDAVLAQACYIPVEYLQSSLKYQKEYMSCFCDSIIDLSVVMFERGKPFCVWPLTLISSNNKWWYSTNEKEVLPPLFIEGIQEKEKKKVIDDCINAINQVNNYLSNKGILVKEWKTKYSLLDAFKDNDTILWYRNCMENGGEADVISEMYLDLSPNMDEIHRKIRKSYRALINKSLKLWKTEIIDCVSDDEIAYFRDRHIEVAGRETRSFDTWKRQQEAVNSGNGFLVKLLDYDGNFVGESLFEVSRDEGLYSVGVYNRDLFDLPVSHVVQWVAIQHMKELGLKYYKIGQRFYKGKSINLRKPTDKELSISYFKEGFMSDMVMTLIVNNHLEK